MKIAILDFETLDTISTSVVTAVPVLVVEPTEILSFDELVGKTLTMKFNWQRQLTQGRTTSEGTMDFWRKPENRSAFDMWVKPAAHDVHIEDFFEEFYKYLVDMGYDLSDNSNSHVYSRGNGFEFPIMDSLYEMYDQQNPLHFWNVRDVRTEIDAIMGHVDPHHEGRGYIRNWKDPENFVKHDPRHDIVRDILQLQQAHMYLIQKLGS